MLMLSLENIFVLMLFAAAGAWLWHNHGLRERALERVKQHCLNVRVELLDDNVALKKIAFIKDASGRRRLARVYNFEFTVTGETRHNGTITQFGAHSAQIELAPYPAPFDDTPPVVEVHKPRAQVVELSQWRQEHTKWKP